MSESQLPPVGTKLFASKRRPNREFVGEIVANASVESGRALLVDVQRYSSLSAAASALAGHARNGREWWRTADGRRLSEQ